MAASQGRTANHWVVNDASDDPMQTSLTADLAMALAQKANQYGVDVIDLDLDEEEDEVTGRMGRFGRKFGDLGGDRADMDWINQASMDEVVTSDTKKTK